MKKNFIPLIICMATLLTASGICRSAEPNKATRWTFDGERAGRVPAGATVFAGSWSVRGEPDAPSAPNALCQTGYADYPALSLSDKIYGDVTVRARFKPVSGNSDRAAGILFRIQDKDNYYILRANALEDNVNIYRYVGGVRRVIKESSAKVTSGIWQELRVEVKGSHIRGFLNGKPVVEADDGTFKAGKTGLWTKSDSVTCFDDVQVDAAK